MCSLTEQNFHISTITYLLYSTLFGHDRDACQVLNLRIWEIVIRPLLLRWLKKRKSLNQFKTVFLHQIGFGQ